MQQVVTNVFARDTTLTMTAAVEKPYELLLRDGSLCFADGGKIPFRKKDPD